MAPTARYGTDFFQSGGVEHSDSNPFQHLRRCATSHGQWHRSTGSAQAPSESSRWINSSAAAARLVGLEEQLHQSMS